MIVQENAAKNTNEKRYRDAESIQAFHDGPVGRCPFCGRPVFMPCLACATELDGHVNDPLNSTEEEPLRIQLEGDQRQRYEYCRLEKFAEAVKREELEQKKRGY